MARYELRMAGWVNKEMAENESLDLKKVVIHCFKD
jgi:hypothetical protein